MKEPNRSGKNEEYGVEESTQSCSDNRIEARLLFINSLLWKLYFLSACSSVATFIARRMNSDTMVINSTFNRVTLLIEMLSIGVFLLLTFSLLDARRASKE